jgi:trimeric autotransporter adhesin
MLNRFKSHQIVFAGIALIIISSVAFASPWTSAMDWLGFGGPASVETAAPAGLDSEMVINSCESLSGGVIEVEGTGGSGAQPTGYPTLTAAFAAINTGVHTGTIVIDVCGNTTEGTATAIINASGSGAASYTTITISPAGGAARTISGTTTAGNPMIDFNGADNITIDGLNTGGNSLTIANTTASATSGTATVRFIGGATSNTITNSSIQGSSSASVATNGGTIFFSTDAVTANGNDNNTISNNNIGPAGANLPSKAILGNGSTTTTAIGNSGIVIDNNNIFDYFAAAVTSSGIATNGGCNAWTITNNRLYQTGTRTWTTGALHVGIDIRPTTATSGAQTFAINGNTIGYASNTQTGTYTLTGAGTGAKFIGILFNGIVTGTTTNVNNNTVAAVSMTGVTGAGTTTASPFTGILIQEGNGITNGNTVGSQSATGSLTFSTTTTTATDVYGIFNFSSNAWTSNNNNVGGMSVTNLGASGTFLVFGMRAFTGSTVTWSATSNNVGGTVANSMQLTATGTSSQLIGMFTSNCPMILTSNTIRNLTSNIGTGTTTAASVAGILNSSTTPNSTLSQNTIFNLTNTNATAASVVTGIQFTGSTANVVERNLIHSLTVASNSTTAEVNGIRVGGGATIYRNNMIAIGAGIANAIGGATAAGISGINEPAAGTDSFFHNSVYIGGAPTAGAGSSWAFNSTQTVNTRSFRDNIFFNARSNSGATGKNYAVRVGGTTANPTGLTINNNLYFANGTGGVFGFFNSLDVANLAAWKTAVGQDAGSFEANPQYNDPTNAVPDLHLHPTNATLAEGNGADVGVINDFDGSTRASLTPVDIGADAGNFVGIDLSAPNISYTPFLNTSVTTNRILTVTITDVTGVATGANAPRIYFNKNAGAYVSTQCTLASGTVNNGTWSCTIDHSLVGGVVATDVIRYFVVAQDTAGNLGANPSGGFTGTNVNTVTTPPTAPNQYTIVAAISGSYDVGTGQTYTSLTNAGGIFEAINNNDVTGNITINIVSDLTGETGNIALNQFASGFSVTIKPSGAPRSITGTGTGGILIKINGADNVTIDGSLSGGTDRSLTLSNPNTATGTGTVFVASLGTAAGATNDTVKNCIIKAGGIGSTSIFTFAVFVGDTTGAAAGADNDNLTIQNNQIMMARTGIQAVGTAAGVLDNLNINGNLVGDNTVANSIGRVGMTVQVLNNASILSNTVKNILLTGDTSSSVGIQIVQSTNSTVGFNTVTGISATGTSVVPQGITAVTATTGLSLNANTVDGINASGSVGPQGITVSTGVTNSSVTRNNVTNINYTGASGYGGKGIEVSTGSASSNVTVANNFVSNLRGDCWSAGANILDTIMGIRVTGSTGGVNIYHNSVNLGTGSFAGNSQPATVSAALYIASTATALNIRNNILTNNLDNTTETTDKNYALFSEAANTAFTDINYNDYWVPVSSATGPQVLGFLTSDRLTLTDIQTATAKDANSISADPLFITATDLHIQGGTPLSPAAGAGTVIAGISGDYDIDPRPASNPDIGADEVVQAVGGTFPSGTFYNARFAAANTLAGNVSVTNNLYLTGITDLGANTVTIGCNAIVSGAGGSAYMIGNVAKDYCGTGAFTYPVGTTPDAARGEGEDISPEGNPSEYTPFDVNITAGTFPSTLTVSVTDQFLPGVVQGNAISRYWSVTESGDLTADMTLHYLDAPFDVNGNESLYKMFKRSGGVTTEVVPNSNNPAANTVSVTGVSAFSDWGAAAAVPTAAGVSLSGRVTTAGGNGIRNAIVTISGNSLPEAIRMQTGAFGYYQFENLQAGQTYIIQVGAKRFRFSTPSRVITVQDSLTDIDFVANPQE